MRERVWRIVTLVLLTSLLVAGYGVVYFYDEANSFRSQNDYLRGKLSAVSETVSIAVSFGNGTLLWMNDTVVPMGSSVFNATYVATSGRLVADAYTLGPVTGVFVTGILGVNSTSTAYWLWYYYSPSDQTWVEAPVGADAYMAAQGGLYLWNFTSG